MNGQTADTRFEWGSIVQSYNTRETDSCEKGPQRTKVKFHRGTQKEGVLEEVHIALLYLRVDHNVRVESDRIRTCVLPCEDVIYELRVSTKVSGGVTEPILS